ncbi:MAG: glutamate-5-semialdehyde dehydrogenase [Spirochaetales bacterium]|nr:glutamate-5-semialdehyde dehydrogenase [Spirochaetales bacterium]
MSNKLIDSFIKVRSAASLLSATSDNERKLALKGMADAIMSAKAEIFAENAKDLEAAKANGTPDAVLHRLAFSEDKLSSVTKGIQELCQLQDPIGRTREKRELDPGFILEKRTFPIGVIGMIFEARPDALVQIASLALRSGNGIILKGGREAANTNRKLVEVIQKATSGFSFGKDWILGIESHEDVDALLKAEGYVDLLIPRGSNAFVRYVMDNTRIPVIGHADGLCTTYVDEYADLEKILPACVDAKIQYPAACNATETFLVHEKIAETFLPMLDRALSDRNVMIHAEKAILPLMPHAVEATEQDFHTEYLALECAVRTVASVQEAVEHIQSHGSHHTDAIMTQNKNNADYFVSKVDSADVFVNCSTRFADGFRFGLGAEVGIATSKLHARGPVGLDGLMTTKWILTGNGETVAEYSGANGKPFHHKELQI